jgi:hypothetical protein
VLSFALMLYDTVELSMGRISVIRQKLGTRTLLFARFRLRGFAGPKCFQNPDLRRS